MRLILNGCEYAGTTTLAGAISRWATELMGGAFGLHDHWKIPHLDHKPLTDEECEQILALSPRVKETFQRYHLQYHVMPDFYTQYPHHSMVGFHIDEAVYAPLYYGYGGDDEYGDRRRLARNLEAHIMEVAPDTVLVQVKASPEVIARRMKESPHAYGVVQEKDIEHVLKRFEEENERSFIRNKFTLDTSAATIEETLAQFVEQYKPHVTEADRLRILTQRISFMGG